LKKTIEQSDKSRDFLNVSILLTVALCIGIYLIITTAIISKDSVTFINYAKQIESDSIKTMAEEFQHPGYPWLILGAHKVTGFLHEDTSILGWIYCAQSVTLIFRLLAIVILYFIGKQLLGARLSLWGVLILILLPKPAEYGSDALSDWPHLCFFAVGLLFLLKGAINERWWLFGFAGLAAGAGYLIRPECAQLVVLGSLWLGLQLLWSKRSISRGKVLSAFALLLVGFLVMAGPYMKLKGAVFPKKNVGQFSQSLQRQEFPQDNEQVALKGIHTLQFTPSNILMALKKLVWNIGETTMLYFVPALLIGLYKLFKTKRWYEPEKFLLIAIIALNIPILVWLFCKHGYISDRHNLPSLILPILYIPVGIQELAIWCHRIISSRIKTFGGSNHHERFWFLAFFLIGVSVCSPKLFKPIHAEKRGYREAAQWLKANTDSADIVAVPDKRISFYAQREGVGYDNETIPSHVAYTVRILNNQKDKTAFMEPFGKVEYKYESERKRGVNVTIHKNSKTK